VRLLVPEPLVGISSVKTHIGRVRRGNRRRRDQAREFRLVDAAETDPLVAQQPEGLLTDPGTMTEFGNERERPQPRHQPQKTSVRHGRRPEGPGELEQNGTEHPTLRQWRQRSDKRGHVGRRRSKGVRHPLPGLHGKEHPVGAAG